MGDIADYTNEIMEDEEAFGDYRGDTEDWMGPPRTFKKCRMCGAEYLHWQHTKEGWRLFEENGTIHKCGEI
jgi:hypothetical protein